jgi:uncharacterized protein (DUF885 family)
VRSTTPTRACLEWSHARTQPGQATSYKVGQLELLRLRDELKTALAPTPLDMCTFHRLVLQAGTVPLDLLPKVTESLRP